MNWKKLTKELNSQFKKARVKLQPGRVHLPSSPIDLDAALRDIAENEEDEDEIDSYQLGEVFENAGWILQPLVDFSWQSFGPMSSGLYLQLLRRPRGPRIITVEQADFEPPWVAIAKIDSALNPRLFSLFFADFLASNGRNYGIELFGSLPSETHNHVPRLLPPSIVKETYWKWMEWADKHDLTDWATLKDELDMLLPSPTNDPLELLKRLPDNLDVKVWLEKHEDENQRLSKEEKRQILDMYFVITYGDSSRKRK